MRSVCWLLLLLSGVAFAERPVVSPSAWTLVSDDDGISVYQKQVDGLDTISLRGEAIIDASPKNVAEVMADNRTAHEWIPMVAVRRTLKEYSPLDRIEYTHVDLPWPLTDRYFVNIGKGELLSDGSIRLLVKNYDQPDQLIAHENDKVLGILHYSEFRLTSLEGGRRTHVQIEVNTDPRGLLPAWLVNATQKAWPRKFFVGLMAQLRQRRLIHDSLGPAPAGLVH